MGKTAEIHNVSILIADDEPAVTDLLAEICREMVRKVHTCGNGNDALEYIIKNDVDLAILDIRMPGLDGIELLKEIKKVKPQVGVIIQSGYFDHDNLRIAMQHSVLDVLTKPCRIDEFKFTLYRAIERIKTERVMNEILELLMYAASDKLKPEDFHKLNASERGRVLKAMLGVLKSKLANKLRGAV